MSKYKSIALLMIFTILMLVILGFAEIKQDAMTVTDIEISIDDQYENYFISESDILQILNEDIFLKGAEYQRINLKVLENKLERNQFVQDAEVFKDLKGKMNVNIMQNRPIARVVRENAVDAYINFDGRILPVSERFTARLPIISGALGDELIANGLQETEEGQQLMRFLEFLMDDPFWKAQIAQIDISKDWDMILYPQISKQLVEFGKPVEIDAKFKNLKIFYTRILPQQGWNTYSRVSVKYQNQIICE